MLDNVKKWWYNIITKSIEQVFGRTPKEQKMYEVVKVVNGYKITRMKGTKGFYHVNIREGKGGREFRTFHTIKSATAFCETL